MHCTMEEQESSHLKRTHSDMESSDPVSSDMASPKRQCVASCPGSGLDSSAASEFKDFTPRKYQLRMYEVARERNTIAVLDTGTGKTMIAVMLIKDIGQAIKSSFIKKLIIFLAPTVHLVNQQYEVIKVNTDFEVGEYYGAKGVDEWDMKTWENEINKHDVLVMTPQILLDVLRKAFLSLDTVSLLVLDECHRATGNHPYARIMKEFYHKTNNKPKIFGMTASPVIRKGVSSAMDCEDQISELESLLASQIYTIEDRAEVDSFVPSAKESCRYYDQPRVSFSDLKEKMDKLLSKFAASMLKLHESQDKSYKDIEDSLKGLQRRLSNDHAKILHCLDDLGLVCAYEAVKVCIENAPNTVEELEVLRESTALCNNFLEEVLSIFGEYPGLDDISLDSDDYMNLVEKGYISPKLHELLLLFQSSGKSQQLLCLIFIQRIVTAKVIERFVKKVSSLAHLTVSYLTGSTTSVDSLSPKVQRETLDAFRAGKINLLFATDVVEEGIHVPNCSVVVRFDLPPTIRSYVQSRGRARQDDSQYVMLLERENVKQRDQVFDLRKSERSMTDTAITRNPDMPIVKACNHEEIQSYRVDATGASVTADSSVSLIQRYCEKLPGDKFYTPKPSFEFYFPEGSCQCKLALPAASPFQTIMGPISRNSHTAKQLVCLEACKKLHQMGALDDHLLPLVEESQVTNIIAKTKEAGVGTTKRKELHGTTGIRALSGSWGEKQEGAVFEAYKFDFACSIVSEVFSNFVLLIESKLDDDVGNVDMDLYLVKKQVKASVSSCGQVSLNAEQLRKAKIFQGFLFNGLFGKLFSTSKSGKRKREFLLQNQTESLWNAAYMYLLLPLETSKSPCNESGSINWSGIDACVSTVEFVKQKSLLGGNEPSNTVETEKSPDKKDPSEKECEDANLIHFANGALDRNSLENMVVLAIHTGKIYSIVKVVDDSSSRSNFDGNADGVESKFPTFADYFNKKYGIVLKHPDEPLMLLKQSHNPHNLLVDFNDEATSKKASKAGIVNEKPRMHVHIPPELLVSVDIPYSVLKSCYLLPSLMQRIESLMLASQLREEINFRATDFHIPSSLILEALTTLRCCETFSMERLELLGDSVLKYAVSCHLYLKYPEKHEGQLSSRRSLAVCNATLYNVGTSRKLQGYIRDSAFDPRRWAAPGQLTLRPVPCKCGVNSLDDPFDLKIRSEDPKVMLGKCCDLGHRWLGSKTISDFVESLIGAYYVSGGVVAALHLMKWLGIDAELEPCLVMEAINNASLRSYVPKDDNLKSIESKIRYSFSVKFLLQEAVTHASEMQSYCYQRLEFLGDSVLDLLITRYLYETHRDVDPGELTDLRSASVNNETFAQVAVRKDLAQHLQHRSTLLLNQVSQYVKSFPEDDGASGSSPPSIRGPKALGDLVESIAGAILIDTKLDIDEVWRIFNPLLSPIVTPDKLELPPLRELIELCDSLGYSMRETCLSKGEAVHAQLKLQLEDVLLIGVGYDRTRKLAKGKAASQLLKELQEREIYRDGPKRKDQVVAKTPTEISPAQTVSKKHTVSSKSASNSDATTPVLGAINMTKGGPRTSMFEFCKKQLWPMPTFETHETKSRTPIEFDDGLKGFCSFISKIKLHLPNFGVIECHGDPRADKKSSFDSAALTMLYELQKQGKLVIGHP